MCVPESSTDRTSEKHDDESGDVDLLATVRASG